MTELLPMNPAESSRSAPAAGVETRSLYRKYRPQTFAADELVGQEHIVRILRNAIRLDRIAHAYLFCGPRGTGKTTTARLLAKAVNCLHPDPDQRPCNECANCLAIAAGTATDVIEIDAASNRGIDDIRDLRERVKYAPVQLRTKFYIVDEAHQITGAAANAFLKTLEEPPPHTKFVLATTDPEELLPTIVSRCQRFDFRRIGFEATVSRLRTVALTEGLAVDDDALAIIARHSTGSLRDGLSLLDQLALFVEPAADDDAPASVTADMVRGVLGVSRNDRVESLVSALADRDPAAALAVINAAVDAGEDPRQINRQLVAYLRVLLHQRAGGSVDADDRARELAARFDLGQLADHARRFGSIDFAIKHSPYSHLPLEVALVEATFEPDRPSTGPAPRHVENRPAPAGAAEPTPIREPSELARPPATPLRDRVRDADPIRRRPTSRIAESAAPAVSTSRVPSPPMPPAPAADGDLTVDQLADLWPRIRQDVKALNRRIEALLASVDPVRVSGNVVILAAAYPFHRDKLNTDDVRSVVEAVISRLVGRDVTVQCALRDEIPAAMPAPRPTPPAGNGNSQSEPIADGNEQPATASSEVVAPTESAANGTDAAQANGAVDDDEDGFNQRVQAARNIFDAELIDPPEY